MGFPKLLISGPIFVGQVLLHPVCYSECKLIIQFDQNVNILGTGDSSHQCSTIHAQKCMTLGSKGENRIQNEFYFTFYIQKKKSNKPSSIGSAIKSQNIVLLPKKS